ncbi:MAG TPA: sigma-70 family RNA polymerase sigma factor [Gemmataceae bacterium]|nr:sigma-70 family RNA polymerase sigma factor [Gemmataceae bacterium]
MEHLRGSARPVADEPTDGELLERFVTDRNEAAFVELVHRHGPMVHGVCRRMLDDAEDVEDAFQATFMILVRKADTIRKRDSAASWLYGVALRVARRARAAITRRRDRERRAAVPEAVSTPEDAWSDVRPVLDDAVDALPEEYRVLVVLCYLQGRTYDEAARLLSLAKGTVSTRLTQARVLLRRKLTRRGLALPVAVLATLLEHQAAPAAVPPQLPPLAVEAARRAAGMGGTVSPQVAYLAQATLRTGKLAGPGCVAVLSLLLIAVGAGLLIWRALTPAPKSSDDGGPQQVWKERFALDDQPFIVYALHFSPDGKLLAGQLGDFSTRVWDTATSDEKLRVAGEPPADPMDSRLYPRCLGFTSDSRAIVVAASDVRVYDVADKKEIARYPGAPAKLSPDARLLATATPGGAIHVIDVAEGTDRKATEPVPAPVTSLEFAPDGKTLAAGAKNGAIYLYNMQTLEQRRCLTGNALPTLDLAFSPDSALLAARYEKSLPPNEDNQVLAEREVKIWQLATGQNLALPSSEATAIAFVPKSGALMTADPRGTLDQWDAVTGEPQFRLGGGTMGSGLLRIVFSPDSESVMSKDPRGRLLVRELGSGRTVASFEGMPGRRWADAAYAPDGRLLAAGSVNIDRRAQNQTAELKVWERVQ